MHIRTYDPVKEVRKALWDSFIDSSNDILKEIQVRTAAKMKEGGGKVSTDLLRRSGDLTRDVQGETKIKVVEGESVSATRTMAQRYSYLLTKGVWTVSDKQKLFFKGLGSRMKKQGQLLRADLYFKMGNIHTTSRIFGRPYIAEAIKETDWIAKVKTNIAKKVPDKIVRIEIGK